MRQTVEFWTEDGTLLRGNLHAPDRVPAPCVIMTHGFSGVVEQIDHYAARFCAAGFVVLAYDHRGFGVSGGSPRLEVDPYRQIADWGDAITFTEGLDQVDASGGVGIWGSSFAGGLAMVVAAGDDRVGCVVIQVPNVSGPRNSRQMFDVSGRKVLAAMIAKDRRARLAGEPPATIPVFATRPGEPCALPPAKSERFVTMSEALAPTWSNEVTVRSVEHMMRFEPAGWAPLVSPTPLMMIVGTADDVTFPQVQLEVFETVREPKKLVMHPGGHFQTYTDHFEQTSDPAADWFTEHLRPADKERRLE